MEPTYKVIICGDRNWYDSELEMAMEQLLVQMPRNVLIIHGACKGVDMTADKIARKLGFNVLPMPANWKAYGKAAGPIRNKEMLDVAVNGMNVVNAVYAFHKDIENSKGTKDMTNQAMKRGVPVKILI